MALEALEELIPKSIGLQIYFKVTQKPFCFRKKELKGWYFAKQGIFEMREVVVIIMDYVWDTQNNRKYQKDFILNSLSLFFFISFKNCRKPVYLLGTTRSEPEQVLPECIWN